MKLEEAQKRVKELAVRMRESASKLQSGAHNLALERDKDAEALELLMGDKPTNAMTCPACGL